MVKRIALMTEDDQFIAVLKDGQHTIGQDGCEIAIADPDVLPFHGVFIVSGTRVFLRPENGGVIWLNGNPIHAMTAVNDGDEIGIGSLSIRLKFVEISDDIPSQFPDSTKPNPFALSESLFEDESSSPRPQSKPVTPLPKSVPPTVTPQAPNLKPISRVPTDTADEVNFTAYYPRELEAERRASFLVYAHLSEAAASVAADARKFVEELGGVVPRPHRAGTTAQIAPGTPITVVVSCNELELEPTSLTRRWDEEWLRFLFEFKPPTSLVNQTIIFNISIQVYGIEVACIANCAVDILPVEVPATLPAAGARIAATSNPLAYAKFTYGETKLYQKIFISYSRHDKPVVEAYRLAQQALGNDVFMDTYSIRAGADWQVSLATAIDEADIFQLFWSEQSANSPNVRDEWLYALQWRCPADDCRSFIRPVFWVEPLPIKPPPELSHLNFRHVPLKGTL